MNFNFDNERPIYVQLVEQLEIAIFSEKFVPGQQLPSVREFSSMLKVNPNTMQKALSELESKELIYTERTNGKFVTTDKKKIQRRKEKYANKVAITYLNSMKELNFTEKDAIEYLNRRKEEK